MTWKLTFPNNKDAEPYLDLDNEALEEAVHEESEKTVEFNLADYVSDPTSDKQKDEAIRTVHENAMRDIDAKGEHVFPDGTIIRRRPMDGQEM